MLSGPDVCPTSQCGFANTDVRTGLIMAYQAKIEVYSTPLCPYCSRAKRLLAEKGAAFTEIDLFADPRRRPEMLQRAGGRTSVPQIFIDGVHVGGSDDLHALDRAGKLDPMLNGTATGAGSAA